MATAKKATMKDFNIKCMVWGEPGAGKSRFALSSPKPLVIDLENSTALYSNEFDFYRAVIDQSKESRTKNAASLTKQVVQEIADGEYKGEIETLVIDPITDLLDNIESILCQQYEKAIGSDINSLNALQKTKWYAYRRDNTRKMLDKIIQLPVNIVLVARSKKVWQKKGDYTQPVGTTYDCLEIVEYLVDLVINIRKENSEITKSRIEKIKEGILENNNWNEINKGLIELNENKLEFELMVNDSKEAQKVTKLLNKKKGEAV